MVAGDGKHTMLRQQGANSVWITHAVHNVADSEYGIRISTGKVVKNIFEYFVLAVNISNYSCTA
jgi:hypothetical protein